MICTLTRITALLSILSLPAVQSQGDNMNTSTPPPRFSPLSRCIRTSSLECVSCSTFVRVDIARGTDCNPEQNLANQVCNRLYDVLQSVANMRTTHPPMDCIEIRIRPAVSEEGILGTHVVNVGDGGIDIRQNVVFKGVQTAQTNTVSDGDNLGVTSLVTCY